MNHHWIDFGTIIIANLFNSLVFGIMLSRPRNMKRLEHFLGLSVAVLAVPLLFVFACNWLNRRSLWAIVLPGLLFVYCLLEFILDYVLEFQFRRTRWLGPYLLLFYAAQWGMIGFAFIFEKAAGMITLFTYFLSLAATGYSYKLVGHGQENKDA